MRYLAKLPLPVSAIGLSFVGLANFYISQQFLHYLFLTLGGGILLCVILKILLNFQAFAEQMKQVPIAGTFGTFSMGILLISRYFNPVSEVLAKIVWGAGLVIHLIVMIYFTMTFVLKKDLSLVIPAWFIIYVGIVAGSITAPAMGFPVIGKILFGFGLMSFIILLPLVIKRIRALPLPNPLMPTLAILSAPVSLNLVGYMNSFEKKMLWFVLLQLAVSQLLYLYVLLKLPKLLMVPFAPAQVGLTFPLVISATAMKASGVFLTQAFSGNAGWLSIIAAVEGVIAVAVVLWVFRNYLALLLKKEAGS